MALVVSSRQCQRVCTLYIYHMPAATTDNRYSTYLGTQGKKIGMTGNRTPCHCGSSVLQLCDLCHGQTSGRYVKMLQYWDCTNDGRCAVRRVRLRSSKSNDGEPGVCVLGMWNQIVNILKSCKRK